MPTKSNHHVSQRIRTIPDKLFYELWSSATKHPRADFVATHTAQFRIKMRDKYSIPIDHLSDLLSYIWEMSNMPMDELVNRTGDAKRKIAYRLCIPPKTFESWIYKGDCPGHIKFILLKEYGLIKLPHHIYTDSTRPKERRVDKEEPIITKEQYQQLKDDWSWLDKLNR